jgi:hypothetical protein
LVEVIEILSSTGTSANPIIIKDEYGEKSSIEDKGIIAPEDPCSSKSNLFGSTLGLSCKFLFNYFVF